jgi:chemotaxis protein histidine kinase CheA
MAIIQALLVRCRQELFAIPVTAISRTVTLADAGLIRNGGRLYLDNCGGGVPVPVITINGDGSDPVSASGVALLPYEGKGGAILVDEVIGRREVLVRPLDPPLRMIQRFSGAAMLDDGSIALVIDPRKMTDRQPHAGLER